MKFLLTILFFIFCSDSFAQVESNNEFVLTPFVGKIGLDTMTREEFIKYGKLEFNSDRIKIKSFLLAISCADCSIKDIALYSYEGDSFVDERTLALLKPETNKGNVSIVFLGIKFTNTKNQVIEFDKNFGIILKE